MAQRIILITGANSGIGYSTTKALTATNPENHVIMACRNPALGQEAMDELLSMRPKIQGTLSLLPLDVTSDTSIEAAVSTLQQTHNGVLDVLINNAGIALTPNARTERESIHEILDTNSVGVLLLTEALLPLLRRSRDPRILNISSGLGSMEKRVDKTAVGYEVRGEAYRMSKAALNMLTVCMAVRYGGDGDGTAEGFGAKVWSVCPGFVVSNLAGKGEETRERRAQMGALSSDTSAETIKHIVEGGRDAQVGKFVHRDGVYGW